jgi:hypothetical protein
MPEKACCDLLQETLNGPTDAYSGDRNVKKENHKELRMDQLRGKKAFCLVDMERVVSPADTKCPDALVKVCDDNRHYFVELKGNGTEASKAVEQIVAGISWVKDQGASLPQQTIYGVIVGSRIPGGNAWNKLKTEFRKKHGTLLIRESTKYTIPLHV